MLEVEKRALKEMVERLEVKGQELRARLEAGAKHYRLRSDCFHTAMKEKASFSGNLQQPRRNLRSSREKGREWPPWRNR